MNYTDFIIEIKKFLQTIRIERNISVHTLRAYESDLGQVALFWQETHQKESSFFVIKTIFDRYIKALSCKKISKRSIARKMSCFTSFGRYIKRTKGLDIPFDLARPRIEARLPVVLTLDEAFFLLDKVHLPKAETLFPYRDKAILEILYATGIRCSELVELQLQDIDPINQIIRIVSKRKKDRLIHLGADCKKKLDLYITHERIKPRTSTEFLFLNYKNEQLTTRSVQRICALFTPYLESKKQITPHMMRHSCATHLIQQGVDLSQVQELLGHATRASTERYTQLIMRDKVTLEKALFKKI